MGEAETELSTDALVRWESAREQQPGDGPMVAPRFFEDAKQPAPKSDGITDGIDDVSTEATEAVSTEAKEAVRFVTASEELAASQSADAAMAYDGDGMGDDIVVVVDASDPMVEASTTHPSTSTTEASISTTPPSISTTPPSIPAIEPSTTLPSTTDPHEQSAAEPRASVSLLQIARASH